MTLLIEDLAGREPTRRITEITEISSETRRLADLLGRPIKDVREDLVRGNSLRTAGAWYTLTD